mmetsp:Transcript_20903/g.58103  ORF Transcript_20903/g.58103 Transcript_20903/m.58103 type:complete len:213 (+) Transcript_20903:271-909(+)
MEVSNSEVDCRVGLTRFLLFVGCFDVLGGWMIRLASSPAAAAAARTTSTCFTSTTTPTNSNTKCFTPTVRVCVHFTLHVTRLLYHTVQYRTILYRTNMKYMSLVRIEYYGFLRSDSKKLETSPSLSVDLESALVLAGVLARAESPALASDGGRAEAMDSRSWVSHPSSPVAEVVVVAAEPVPLPVPVLVCGFVVFVGSATQRLSLVASQCPG